MNRNRLFTALSALPLLVLSAPAYAQDSSVGNSGYAYMAAGLCLGLAALGAALGQGNAAKSALEAVGRNPNAASKIQTQLIVSLVFMETLVLFSFGLGFLLQSH